MFSSNNLMSMKRTRSLDNLFIFRESEKNLKMTPVLSFFVMIVSRGQKDINYHSKDALSNLLMSGKGSKITQQYFHV